MATTQIDAIPTGLYVAELVESQGRPDENGRPWLDLVFEITEGPYAGQRLRKLLCPTHPSFLARTFFRAKLAELCRAIGVAPPKNCADPTAYATMHHKPVVIDVRRDECPATGITYNRIEGYMEKQH